MIGYHASSYALKPPLPFHTSIPFLIKVTFTMFVASYTTPGRIYEAHPLERTLDNPTDNAVAASKR